MSRRFDQLSGKHRALRERCAVQRVQIAQTAQEIQGQLGTLDRRLDVVRRVARSPLLIVGAIAVIALIGPGRLVRLAGRGFTFYATARRVAGAVRAARRRREQELIADDSQ